MEVIPFFGGAFNDFMPVLLAVFCLCTLFNVYGRILRLMGVERFEFSEDFDDETIAEGKMILRKEKRKRGYGTKNEPIGTALL